MDTFTRFTVPALRLSEHFDGVLNSFEMGMLLTGIENQPFTAVQRKGIRDALVAVSKEHDSLIEKVGRKKAYGRPCSTARRLIHRVFAVWKRGTTYVVRGENAKEKQGVDER